MRHLPGLLMLVTVVTCNAEQMKVQDLYKMCTSSTQTDKTACTFYILGVFEGAGLLAGTVKDKGSGTFQELKEKSFCVPEGMSSTAMELVIKKKMGEDLAVFPQDREMPAVSLVVAVIAHEFPCKKPK